MSKIPVTVLTGFLGAGKTTLVNHILTAEHGHRIAVIENEFGEIPIDDALVLRSDEEFFEMSNGCCICCTARTDLIDILRKLIERKDKIDRVLIETTGLADPNPVAQTFYIDEEISEHFALDAIVTLVDSKHIGRHLDGAGVGHQAVDQIAFADRLVLNKIDLVTEPELAALRERLRGINATAEIITSNYSKVDLTDILGVGAFSRIVHPAWLDEQEHFHDPAVSSVGIELDSAVDGDLDEGALRAWLGRLTDEHGDDLYRLKGVLAVREDSRRFVLQGIHRIFELRPAEPWGRDSRGSKVVFIGRDLDRASLVDGLRTCVRAA
ncbi:GTPase, G3E family [Saccharopolyspora kobensis]|uniref:GTPase, G3E family n=1 Tax=Saccharopolyspora kobensis TaxID=146035 RepID=A0A1H5UPE7_9PSEU|nr:GTP-binding protein [Saccharopolyspora kobensis]SEF76288.1 GTPase, G3E family [Saccharopolyspora kobensis]SFC71702.1 GTPase, G3E family [Saccharopolyspora kobensis]